MRVVIDGLIFQKDPHGGIARLFTEILPRMCHLAPDLDVQLFLDGPLRASLPAHAQISLLRAPAVKRTLRVQGFWRKVLYPFWRVASRTWNLTRGYWLGSGQGAIWHSTYYTLPGRWRGPQVVSVYDLIQEKYADLFDDPLEEIGRQQKRRCIEQAAAVICISHATRQDVDRFYPQCPAAIYVIPIAHSPVFRRLAQTAPPLEYLPEAPFLLYVGSRVKYKNFTVLLHAYAAWEGRSQVALAVVGPPWSAAERRMLHEMGLATRVRLLGHVSDERLCELYNQALAFVHPSLDEGFGIPLLEAMACGCLVIASRIPSTLEVAGDCPFYFDPIRPESLSAAFDQARAAAGSPARIQAGLARAGQFSWERTARETLDVYRCVQEGKANG